MSTKYPSNAFGTPFLLPRAPQRAPKWPKGCQSVKKGIHLGRLFRNLFALFLPWMPDGVQKGDRTPSNTLKFAKSYKKGAPGHQNRFRKRPKAHKNRYQTEHLKKHLKTVENKLNNPNTKNCKEPCTPREPPRRNKTSRCGGVASSVLNIWLF